MAKKIYITSAIPYVNAAPHIGHAQEFVYADVIRRYHILRNENVRYLCGADENALKIVQAAEKAGQTTQEFTDYHQSEFLNVAKSLNVRFDVWQRGTDRERHFPSSQKLWNLCNTNGDIYKKSYEGLYCVGCEAFYTQEELDENGECFEHPGKKLEKVSETNYFFRLSKFQEFLEELITSNRLQIFPDFRKNEALSFIRRGLEDFSISRSKERARGWGVPVPGDTDQIMYVWFDALNIYQSGIGFGWDENQYEEWSPQDVMVIGKGIIRFHAIYWPAILRSAGLELPRQLFVHGYLTVDGQKMSKTLGNVVDPLAIIHKHGTDSVRYYLTREIPPFSDGDFSERRFVELYNADLANGLGNLIARLAKLAEGESFGLSAPDFSTLDSGEYEAAMSEFRFHDAIAVIWEHIKHLDIVINELKPWTLAGKERKEGLHDLLPQLLEIAVRLKPFLPETSEHIINQFTETIIKTNPPLFPRIQ